MHLYFLHDRCSTVALLGMCMLGSVKAGGVRPDGSTAARRVSETPGIQSVHFSENLNGTDVATVLEAGGFKLTASCKTVTYTYNFYGGYSSYSSSSFHHGGHTSSYHSSHEEGEAEGPSHQPRHSNGFGSPQRGDALEREGGGHGGGGRGGGVGRGRGGRGGRDPGGGGGDGGRGAGRGGPSSASPAAPPSAPMFPAAWESESYWSTLTDDSTHTDDDGEDYSYLFHQEYSHTETFAALELTYTASDEDYLYGSPSYSSYPDETQVAGSYESGESRTQIVFAGRDGSWGDTCTMQSMSGDYVTLGQKTVGVHRSWMEEGMVGIWGVGEIENSSSVFPEGVDCMVAGVVTFVESNKT